MAESGQEISTLQTLTSTPAPQSTQKPPSKGIDVRVVVGIAVGVGVFVAALTAMSVFILMRRYTLFPRPRKRSSIDTESRSRNSRMFPTRLGKRRSGRKVRRDPSVKAQKQSAVPEEEGTVQFIDLDRDLPQPISEGDLLHYWENLSVSIKNHVTDCYHRAKAKRYYVDKSSPLAYLEPHQLADPKSRHLAIRQCIGKFIVENIRPDGNPDDTFLPPKLVSIIHSMPITADEKSPRKFLQHVIWLIRVLTFPPKFLKQLWRGGESLPASF